MTNSPLPPFSWVFLVALLLTLALRLWLGQRQAAHVTEHRNEVPEQFAGRIALAAHQKAADYTQIGRAHV